MMILPPSIRDQVGDASYEMDSIGLSGSSVLLFPDKVLKILPRSNASRQSAEILRWLQGRLPAPELLGWEEQGEHSFLLMSRVPGEMACTQPYIQEPEILIRLLAEGLKRLWAVDIQDCPVDQRLDRKLLDARYRVEHGLVDTDNVQPDTFGPGGFRDPEELLRWLEEHRPEEELVLSHGDHCLPNVFFDRGQFSGYIDLDRCGVADKWCDLALCWRSLRDNFGGVFGGKVRPDFDPDTLFRELALEPNEEKLRYYILLYELF